MIMKLFLVPFIFFLLQFLFFRLFSFFSFYSSLCRFIFFEQLHRRATSLTNNATNIGQFAQLSLIWIKSSRCMRNKRTDVHRECNTVGNWFVRVGKIILRRIREKEHERLSIKKYDAVVFFFPSIRAQNNSKNKRKTFS